MRDEVLTGIGSGGPGFNNYRPNELAFLIEVARNPKAKPIAERKRIFTEYDAFVEWIDKVPQEGHRQFRHMLRYFAFPDRVERISSNNDRQKICCLRHCSSPGTGAIDSWTTRCSRSGPNC